MSVMVKYGNLKKKEIQIEFTKDDLDGFVIDGEARFDSAGVVINVFGILQNTDGRGIARFSVRPSRHAGSSINIFGCPGEQTEVAVEAIKKALDDLSKNPPVEL